MGQEISTIPRHVAIIPDGNRRWAKDKGIKTLDGHRAGVDMFEQVAEHAWKRGVEHLTMWGLSLDNLTKRSNTEVSWLMRMFRQEFGKLTDSEMIHRRRVSISVRGRWREKFPKGVTQAIDQAIKATSGYEERHLNFLLAYNGTDEMMEAIKGVVKEAKQHQRIRITDKKLESHLWTGDLPEVDLVIRTAGDPHLSNGFMMWKVADAELYFSDKMWPDFSSREFDKALRSFGQRRRMKGR